MRNFKTDASGYDKYAASTAENRVSRTDYLAVPSPVGAGGVSPAGGVDSGAGVAGADSARAGAAGAASAGAASAGAASAGAASAGAALAGAGVVGAEGVGAGSVAGLDSPAGAAAASPAARSDCTNARIRSAWAATVFSGPIALNKNCWPATGMTAANMR